MVVIVPEELIVPFAGGVTLVGERVQVEPAGAPEQLKVTLEAKALKDVTVTVMLAGLPAFTIADEGVSVSVKSGGPGIAPVPASATC